MHQAIIDDIYYIYSDDNKELLKIELSDLPNYQITITTNNEVYSGPIEFISFSSK